MADFPLRPEAAEQPARLRVVIVTNIPAPYRLPVYAALAAEPDLDLHVVYCGEREPDRAWDLAGFRFAHTFLKPRFITVKGRFIHLNRDVWPALQRLRPQVVVTTGFNPTHLLAYAWARRHGAAHVAMTDGTAISEQKLGAVHRAVRRWVFARTRAFIGASDGAFALYAQYGIPRAAMFKSHLCADNAAFLAQPAVERDVDLIYCARFVEIKQPLFALAVAVAVAGQLGRRVRMICAGSGPLEVQMREHARRHAEQIDVEFPGFARQAELPALYARAKLQLFPTVFDPWGVVANEACAAGVPVLTTPVAGVAGEIVRDGENGHVLQLDVDAWAKQAAALLADDTHREAMAQRGRELVAPYTYRNAALGLAAAVRHAVGRPAERAA